MQFLQIYLYNKLKFLPSFIKLIWIICPKYLKRFINGVDAEHSVDIEKSLLFG